MNKKLISWITLGFLLCLALALRYFNNCNGKNEYMINCTSSLVAGWARYLSEVEVSCSRNSKVLEFLDNNALHRDVPLDEFIERISVQPFRQTFGPWGKPLAIHVDRIEQFSEVQYAYIFHVFCNGPRYLRVVERTRSVGNGFLMVIVTNALSHGRLESKGSTGPTVQQ
jgi:hypothetical protein